VGWQPVRGDPGVVGVSEVLSGHICPAGALAIRSACLRLLVVRLSGVARGLLAGALHGWMLLLGDMC